MQVQMTDRENTLDNEGSVSFKLCFRLLSVASVHSYSVCMSAL